MNKKKYFVLTTILFFSLLPKTYASCTQKEINEFQKIEDDYKITYEFNKDTKDYTVSFYSPIPERYNYYIIIDIELNCKKISDNLAKCYNVLPGEYPIEIVGLTNTCNDILKENTLKLSEYNEYSEDPLCDGIEEFYLCQPTYDKKIDRETFISRVNTYKNTLKNENEEIEKNEKTKENNTIEYLRENLIQIIIIIVFIVLVITTIILTAKSIREGRRLE